MLPLNHRISIFNRHKKLRSGERILEIIDSVEDSKGNAGDIGRVAISNLRIMWFSLTNPKFTLCKWNKLFSPVSGDCCQRKHYETSSETLFSSHRILLYRHNEYQKRYFETTWQYR